MFRRVGIAVALALGSSIPASSDVVPLSGRVADEAAAPVVHGRVCYLVGTVEQVCSELDEDGRFSLPGSQLDRMRIVAEGFLPRVVAAVQQEEPWILEPAAILRVRLRDERSGEAVGEGKVEVVYASGRRRGPFPANLAGVRVRTMDPGEVRLFASAEGYRSAMPVAGTLVAGEQLEIVIDLSPADEPREESAPTE